MENDQLLSTMQSIQSLMRAVASMQDSIDMLHARLKTVEARQAELEKVIYPSARS